MTDKPFDWRTAMDGITEDEPTKGRKLAFYDQCCAFAALRYGASASSRKWRNPVVAKAFGVSVVTISQLNSCLTSMSVRPHYRNVAGEWRSLGEDEFMRQYYTESVHNRLIVARSQIPRRMLK